MFSEVMRPQPGLETAQVPTRLSHEQVRLLAYEEITERRFGGWTMGQVNLAKVNPSQLLKYFKRAELDPFDAPGSATLSLLSELVASASLIGRGD